MKRLVLMISIATLLVTSSPRLANSSGLFDQQLSKDRQIAQVLNRLTFGPRPGDAEEVRRLGVAKWIAVQLHPERIPENPVLEGKLKPLESLRMDLPELVKEYTPQPNNMMMMMMQPMLNTLLSQEEMRKVQMGTAEERTAVLKSLDPDKRRQVLATLACGCATKSKTQPAEPGLRRRCRTASSPAAVASSVSRINNPRWQ